MFSTRSFSSSWLYPPAPTNASPRRERFPIIVTSSRATYDVTGAPTLGPFGLKSCVRLVSVTRPVKRASP
jgi:hypothetical protein